ncbi:MAG: hypothetical protein EXQ67_00175 [Thermoleophilia bacterium]|nr:hypothetical protein [Thermoleophilia bacterium]
MAGVDIASRVDRIVELAAQSSDVWARSVLAPSERDGAEVFGPIAGDAFADGVETIYEGYLVHHAPRGRVFAAPDREQGLLLGDYLYATGLVQVCAAGDVEAIAALADLVSLAAHLRAEGGVIVDAELWLATVRHLAGPRDQSLSEAREALRTGDPTRLSRLVADVDAVGPLAEHRRLMRDAR